MLIDYSIYTTRSGCQQQRQCCVYPFLSGCSRLSRIRCRICVCHIGPHCLCRLPRVINGSFAHRFIADLLLLIFTYVTSTNIVIVSSYFSRMVREPSTKFRRYGRPSYCAFFVQNLLSTMPFRSPRDIHWIALMRPRTSTCTLAVSCLSSTTAHLVQYIFVQ